jgi:hypothetical protein
MATMAQGSTFGQRLTRVLEAKEINQSQFARRAVDPGNKHLNLDQQPDGA